MNFEKSILSGLRQNVSIHGGFRKIVAIKASFNHGLSSKLEAAAFPNTVPVDRSLVQNLPTPDPEWLAGFTSGEGCFYVKEFKSKEGSIGFNVKLTFQFTQHAKDEQLMKSFMEYLDCRKIYKKGEAFDFRVTKFSDNYSKIILFFKKYLLHGVKSKDFEDFCMVVEIIKKKEHLTEKGLDQIHEIKAEMNTGRKWD